ncbi:MAG: succinate dehydrogenase/fumarate reductase iron-sulfur subunit, partial [Gemmatimonadota bacterium]
METVSFKVWRGDADGGEFRAYDVEVQPGFVVLDAVRKIQADQAHDMAIRWNCKA